MGVFAYIKNGVKYKMNQFPGAYPASRVSYNGSDVETALDELNADLTGLFSIETFDFYTKTGSNMGVPANGEASVPVNIAKTGYTPIMAMVELTGSVACFVYQSEINGAYLTISLHNVGSARVEVSPHVRIVYLKD